MLNGIYSAEFRTNLNTGGTGVIIIDGGRLHGGDTSFFYKGKFLASGKNEKNFTAVVEVGKYSSTLPSIFGPLDSVRLNLNGFIEQGGGFTLSGQVEGKPEYKMTVKLQKLSELIDDQ